MGLTSLLASIGVQATADIPISLITSIILALVVLMALVIILSATGYIVRQQHVAIVERLGRFHKITRPGLHLKVPFMDRAFIVNLQTEDEHVQLDAKTKDNVTIKLDVSVQYRVDSSGNDTGQESGVYRAYYLLQDPVGQMRDYIRDALRSEIPTRDLEDVFTAKDAIAAAIDEIISEKMLAYGYIIVTTLIVDITLPADIEASMNRIIASKNNLESATNDANAEKQRVVIAAEAEAAAMKEKGRGIAEQRVAIAAGIKDSLDMIRQSGVSVEEANRLYEYTQYIDMMTAFAKSGKASTVVLPNEFDHQSSTFEQILAARKAE